MISIKSQVATEYLVVAGLVLLILIPLTFLYFKYTNESSYTIAATKAEAIANEIAKAANDVYVYGRDSQFTIEADFPEGIKALFFQGNEVTFVIIDKQGKLSEIAKVSDATFSTANTAKIPIFPGKRKILVKSLGSQVLVTIPCISNPPQVACATTGTFDGCTNECVITCVNSIWALTQQCTSPNIYCKNNVCSP